MPDNKTLLYVVNNPAFFRSHRLPIAVVAIRAGYQVHIACPDGQANTALTAAGLIVHELELSRKGFNLFREIKSVISLLRLYKRIEPDVIHHITPKPNIYGGLAARLSRMPAVVFSVSGMGYIFSSNTLWARILRPLIKMMYRLSFSSKRKKVIVQNADDLELITSISGVSKNECVLIPGSGVDLSEYFASSEPEGPCVVVIASRLLKDKGIWEFVEAAKHILAKGSNARFVVAGEVDEGNPASLSSEQIQIWKETTDIEFLGQIEDVAGLYRSSNLVVLPSYREGLPRALIEAAASGRAIVTTDVPGCRDAILPGKSGFLVPARDSFLLAKAIERLINDSETRRRMGDRGRLLAEDRFSISTVIAEHMRIYQELLR